MFNIFKSRTKKKKLFVHVGMPKTGTTTIQLFLYHNQASLLSHGVLYANTGLDVTSHHVLANSLFREEMLTRKRGKMVFTKAVCRSLLKKLYREIETSGVDAGLISSEVLWQMEDFNQLKLLLDSYIPRVIVYIRRQDKALLSSYSSMVMQGRTFLHVDEFFEKYKNDFLYYKKLDSIAQVVGEENVCVRLFEPNEFVGNDLVTDFLSTVGVNNDSDQFDKPGKMAHTSVSLTKLEFKRMLNEYNVSIATHRKIQRLIRRAPGFDGDGDYELLQTKSQREKLLKYYQDDNKAVKDRFFPDLARLTLFDMKINETEESIKPSVSLEQATKLFAYILKNLDSADSKA